jgi:hypothetical protein
MKKAVVIIVLTIMCISGCRVGTEKDIHEVKDTILRYNQLLSEGYAKMNMTPLKEVATEEHAVKVYHHMAALGEAKVRMESKLVNIEFTDIQFPKKDFAKVKTKEKWDYTHVNIGTKMPAQTVVQGLIYKLSYDLIKKDGRWLVSSISVLEEKKPSEKKN